MARASSSVRRVFAPTFAAAFAMFAAASCGDGSSTSTGGTGGTTGSGGDKTTGGGGTGGTTSASSGGGTGGTTMGSGGTAGGGGETTGSGGGGGIAPLCPPETGNPIPPLKLTEVASGLSVPVLAIGAPGDTSRLYIVEQVGRIRILKDGALVPGAFLDISDDVAFIGEQGLLGLAFHPDFANNGRFFVDYTQKSDDHSTIVEYVRSDGDPDKADPVAIKTLYTVDETQFGNHNGGMIAFGPDGYLYIAHGDGGGVPENAQDTTSMLGKLLRIDVDSFPVPAPGNLQGGNPHIWDYGLRNPWRFSFDLCTGDLYIGDVGAGAREEIDVEPAGQGLKNYGWDITEGTLCHTPPDGCDMAGITPPVIDYSHALGCSVTGGYVYRGSKIPDLVGAYLYGDYCSGRIWSFRWKDGALVMGSEIELTADLDTSFSLSSFGQSTDGELYAVDLGGFVYRVDAE